MPIFELDCKNAGQVKAAMIPFDDSLNNYRQLVAHMSDYRLPRGWRSHAQAEDFPASREVTAGFSSL